MSGARAAGGAGLVAGSTLPFTGFSVFWVTLVAAGLLLAGLALVTAARPRRDKT